MKKRFAFIFALLFYISGIFSETVYLIHEGRLNDKGLENNLAFLDLSDIYSSEVKFYIYYSNDSDIFYFKRSDDWIDLTHDDMSKLCRTLKKFLDWEKIAVEKEFEVNKEIPDSTITTNVSFKQSDKQYYAKNLTLKFNFISKNTKKHQLCISADKIEGGEYGYEIVGYYFDKYEIQQLYNSILEDKLNKTVLEIKDKINKKNKMNEEIDSLLN